MKRYDITKRYDPTSFSECFEAMCVNMISKPEEIKRFFTQVDWTSLENKIQLLHRIKILDEVHNEEVSAQILAVAGEAGIFNDPKFLLRFFEQRTLNSRLITENRKIISAYGKTIQPELILCLHKKISAAIGHLKMVYLIMFGIGHKKAISKYPRQTLKVLQSAVEDPEARSFLISWGFTSKLINFSVLPKDLQEGYKQFFEKLGQE